MKITKEYLKKIIKEEIENFTNEGSVYIGDEIGVYRELEQIFNKKLYPKFMSGAELTPEESEVVHVMTTTPYRELDKGKKAVVRALTKKYSDINDLFSALG